MSLDWILGIGTSLAAAAIGFTLRHALDVYRKRRAAAGQSAILAGIEMPALFVFPLREEVKSAVLPRTATEDFLAINNIISAFIQIDRSPPAKVKDSSHLTDEDKRHNNLILICSSKRNPTTKEAIDKLRSGSDRLADFIPAFEEDPSSGRLQIKWNKGTFPSESFDQEGPEYVDIALIIKSRSPWAGQHKVLIVAGIRGFGTWGAAEFLKKWWKPLYDRKSESKERMTSKDGDFAALVSVRYEDYDIKAVKLVQVIDLDEAYLRSDSP